MSKKLIKDENYKFSVEFFYEPKKGICFARNKTVELAKNTKYCFFVDDDQILDSTYKGTLKTAIKIMQI